MEIIKNKKGKYRVTFVKVNDELFDCENTQRNTLNFIKKSRFVEEDPIISKPIFYHLDQTIEQLYLKVFRKIYGLTEDSKQHNLLNLKLENFAKIWVNKFKRQNQLFYLKLNGVVLDKNNQQSLREILKNKGEFHTQAFLYSSKSIGS